MAAMPVGVRCISHIAITVADIDRSIDFYRSVLGFELLVDNRTAGTPRASVVLGDTALELFEGPAGIESYVPEPTTFGLPKLALTVEDVGQAVAALEALGVEVWGERFQTPVSSLIWIRDPDGVPIQLHAFASGARNVVELFAGS
jgi:glyoxylase I family protein